jgi:hypothetical protein
VLEVARVLRLMNLRADRLLRPLDRGDRALVILLLDVDV